MMRGHMSTRLLNVALFIFVLFSTALANNANAGLIEETIYTDSDGVEWIYFGSFVTNDGPVWSDAQLWNDENGNSAYGDIAGAVNGLEAAAIIFGLDINDIALSAYGGGINANGEVYLDPDTDDLTQIAEYAPIVNHDAWYVQVSGPVVLDDEDAASDDNGDGVYSEAGDQSAYVNDRSDVQTTYVFKAVEVPEPSTLAIFSLALFALSTRRFKKQ